VRDPEIIRQGAQAFGNQCIVLGMDALEVDACDATPSGYEIVVKGGRERTRIDALEWAQRAEELGAGEIGLNSIDTDGTRDGYEIELTAMIARGVGIPVIASGGAGEPRHLAEVLTRGEADAALIASMVHFGDWDIAGIKRELEKTGARIRDLGKLPPEPAARS